MKIVICPPIDADRLARLHAALPGHLLVNAIDAVHAAQSITDADAFLGKITPTMLAHATQLQWVQSFTASLEHYIFPALVEHPCTLTNMRGLFSDVIADQVMGYVLCFARNLHLYIRQQAAHLWSPIGGENERVSFAAGPGVRNGIDLAHAHLSEQTLGIVGLGEIGAEIARRAKAFGMRIVAVDPRRTACPPEVDWLRTPHDVPELLAQSDYVVVAAPHTPQTAKMFQRTQFQQMKRQAFFINIGRGAIVDLADLVAALDAKEIAGAALDVFEVEPLPTEHALWAFPNVILTPHVAGYSPRIAERHFQLLSTNLQRFVNNQPLLNIVDKNVWF